MTERELIKNCFKRTVAGNSYNLDKANSHQRESGIFSMSVHDAVMEIIRFLDVEHVGCCLHYSIFLTATLEDFGINARFATIPDDDNNGGRTHKHACVWFEIDGKEFIADPAKAIMTESGNVFCFMPIKKYMKSFLQEGESLSIYAPLSANANNTNFTVFVSNPEATASL